MMNYVCPICNAKYESVDSLESCVSNCAKKVREFEQKQAQAQKKARQELLAKELKKKEEDIRRHFAEFMSYVDEYNKVAAELRMMNTSTKTCQASLSFSCEETKTKNKGTLKSETPEDKDGCLDVSDLLRAMLGV